MASLWEETNQLQDRCLLLFPTDTVISNYWNENFTSSPFSFSAYFGKYLNNYDGLRVPPGWDDWSGLVKNSRYYNYSLNINGKIVRHNSDYKKDYFTDLMARDSANYFRRHVKTSSKPLFMVVSMAAPHGPEDSAPQYQNHFENITAPR